jgi:hypothetical protein
MLSRETLRTLGTPRRLTSPETDFTCLRPTQLGIGCNTPTLQEDGCKIEHKPTQQGVGCKIEDPPPEPARDLARPDARWW